MLQCWVGGKPLSLKSSYATTDRAVREPDAGASSSKPIPVVHHQACCYLLSPAQLCAPDCSGHGRCWRAHLGGVRSSLHRPALRDLCHTEWPGSGVFVWHGHSQVRTDVALPLFWCALQDIQQQQHGSLPALQSMHRQPQFSQPDCMLCTQANRWLPTSLVANGLLSALDITCMLGSKALQLQAIATAMKPCSSTPLANNT